MANLHDSWPTHKAKARRRKAAKIAARKRGKFISVVPAVRP